MNASKKLNVIYLSSAVLLIACLMLSFLSWNKEKLFTKQSDSLPQSLVKYNIDYCRPSGSHIDLKGWIFTDSYPQNGRLLVTATIGGKEIVIPSFTYVRPDVSAAFNRNIPFDNVGFNASISTKFMKMNSSSSFNVYIETKEKLYKAVTYACK